MVQINNRDNFNELIQAWDTFVKMSHWQKLIEGREHIISANGLIYELPNYLNRKDESFAIADMRHISASEPHYHVETEVYFVLQGGGVIIVGGQEQIIVEGDIIVIPSNLAHCVIPNKECIIGIINTPPFNIDNYKIITETNPHVYFDQDQFLKLKHKQSIEKMHE